MLRITVCLLVLLVVCSTERIVLPTESRVTFTVILVSLDGFHPDYLDRGLTPTLNALAESGVRAEWLDPVFPTKTFPNHYTIVTGLFPGHHGIIDNSIVDPELGRFTLGNRDAVGEGRWWGGEPIWVTAQRQGLRAATLFWPGSEAPIQGIRPTEWLPFDSSMSVDDRVDLVLEWLDRPDDEHFDFITLYFEHVDTAGHRFGPASVQVDSSLVLVDQALRRLIRGIQERRFEDQVDLILVSDHGMAAHLPDALLILEDIIDPDLVEIAGLSEIAGFTPTEGNEAAVRDILLTDHEGMTCYQKGDMPGVWHYNTHPRIPEIVCLLDEGWRFIRRDRVESGAVRPDRLGGSHGYHPALPSMRALFIATGPSFRSGEVVPAFGNIHLYELLTRLLDIEPAPNDGDPRATEWLLR